jgi:D-sedoheptulose 7-phosphate isomerase
VNEGRKLILVSHIIDHREALDALVTDCADDYCKLVDILCDTADSGGRVFTMGNGGSACDAMHFVGELIGSYKIRKHNKFPLSATCLNSDICTLTAVSNDFGYNDVYSHQMVSYGVGPKDVVIGFTTSGKSPNVVAALDDAKDRGAFTVCFTGNSGASYELAKKCDLSMIVKSTNTPTIQECHIILIHAICDQVEKYLVEKGDECNRTT